MNDERRMCYIARVDQHIKTNFKNEMGMIENWKFRMNTFALKMIYLAWSVVENEWKSLNLI